MEAMIRDEHGAAREGEAPAVNTIFKAARAGWPGFAPNPGTRAAASQPGFGANPGHPVDAIESKLL